jgi:hypothetical protein
MISLLCPTRGRPERAEQLLDSFLETQNNQNEIIFALQSDDPALDLYKKKIKKRAVILEPSCTVHYWNTLAKMAKGNLLTLIGDDVIIKTKGWDTAFEDASNIYKDKMFIITTQDGRSTPRAAPDMLPTPHPTISREWYNTLGYLAFPGLFHYYADDWNSKIARKINRQINLYDVTFEHLKEIDDTRIQVRKNRWQEFDKEKFKMCRRHFASDLELIKKNIKNEPKTYYNYAGRRAWLEARAPVSKRNIENKQR